MSHPPVPQVPNHSPTRAPLIRVRGWDPVGLIVLFPFPISPYLYPLLSKDHDFVGFSRLSVPPTVVLPGPRGDVGVFLSFRRFEDKENCPEVVLNVIKERTYGKWLRFC